MKYQQTFTFVATGASTTLTFTSTTNDDPVDHGDRAAWGPVIDDVSGHGGAGCGQDPRLAHLDRWSRDLGSDRRPTPAWHPTNGDPQSEVHKYENHDLSVSRTTSPTTATRAAALGSSGPRLIHRTTAARPASAGRAVFVPPEPGIKTSGSTSRATTRPEVCPFRFATGLRLGETLGVNLSRPRS